MTAFLPPDYTIAEAEKKRVPDVIIDPKLDKYNCAVLFPEKLAKANEMLKKSGAPKLPKKKHSR